MTLQSLALGGPETGPGIALLPVNDLRSYLTGGWTLKRAIREGRWRQEGDFEGEAEFTPLGDGLAYREAGRMRLGDYDGRATRCYLFDFAFSYLAKVSFEDGRPFHDLDLRSGRDEVFHLCGRDRYAGVFQAIDPDTWSVRWRVEGPHKALRIESRYSRR